METVTRRYRYELLPALAQSVVIDVVAAGTWRGYFREVNSEAPLRPRRSPGQGIRSGNCGQRCELET